MNAVQPLRPSSTFHSTYQYTCMRTVGPQNWTIIQLPLPLSVDILCACPLKVGLWYVRGENGEGASEVLARTIG